MKNYKSALYALAVATILTGTFSASGIPGFAAEGDSVLETIAEAVSPVIKAATPSNASKAKATASDAEVDYTMDIELFNDLEGDTATPSDAELDADLLDDLELATDSDAIPANCFILPEPTRKGYDFIEWNTEKDGSGDSYYADEIIEIEDMTLYAIWEPQETLASAAASSSTAAAEAVTETVATPSDAEPETA